MDGDSRNRCRCRRRYCSGSAFMLVVLVLTCGGGQEQVSAAPGEDVDQSLYRRDCIIHDDARVVFTPARATSTAPSAEREAVGRPHRTAYLDHVRLLSGAGTRDHRNYPTTARHSGKKLELEDKNGSRHRPLEAHMSSGPDATEQGSWAAKTANHALRSRNASSAPSFKEIDTVSSKVYSRRRAGSKKKQRSSDDTAGAGGVGVTEDERVRGGEGAKWMRVDKQNVDNMQGLSVLPSEGIIYCPIPKVASAEWKRALRWMVGIKDWRGEHTNLHSVVKNGLERLVDWGIESTEWALNSDRFLKFVVVRDPAERLVSAFLNKCVLDGYMSGRVKHWGAPSCAYLTLMPDLFPNVTKASLKTHGRLKELVEGEPEDTFYHFVLGIQRAMQQNGGTCNIFNHHFRPQYCFCQLHEFLPLYHVMAFSNMSAEASALARRLPEEYDMDPGQVLLDGLSPRKRGGNEEKSPAHVQAYVPAAREATAMEPELAALGIGKGVDDARREEIRVFLTKRFERARDSKEKVTGAAEQKSEFLSKRVMAILQQIYAEDYDMFGDYF